jgi:hypothetical protein
MKVPVWPAAILGMLFSACAMSPQKPPPVVIAAPAAASQTTGATLYATAELDKRARGMSYRVETRNGERRYCRNNAPTGSHISREACITADDMARAAKAADDDQDQISQRQLQSSSGGARLP